ncbi:MAG: hypothetical protein AABP62_07890 [Planctomycetota bacterium]
MTQASPNSERPQGGGAMFFLCGLLIGAATVGFALAARSARQATPDEIAILAEVPPTVKLLHPSNAPGLHNVYRLGDHLYSGSSPDDEEAFATLARLGVKTVISVDGATPDVEMARQFDLRYVHLPISYSSVPRETLVQLVRASRELPGPIYLHCHHGKHRGPAAAVSLWRCLDKSVSDEQAFATLKSLGTADRYQGLYSSVKETVPPKAAELAASQASLPEVTPVPPLAKTMAEIDRMWDRVTATESDSTAVSMQLTIAFDLAEHFREAARLAEATDDMRPNLIQAADELDLLAETIKSGMRNSSAPNPTRTEAIARVKVRCNECHAKLRD